MIKRDFYLNQIIERMWNGNIKVITGIRRGGKSTLLFGLFKEYLLSTGVSKDNIIEIELDKRKYYKLWKGTQLLYKWFWTGKYMAVFSSLRIFDNWQKGW